MLSFFTVEGQSNNIFGHDVRAWLTAVLTPAPWENQRHSLSILGAKCWREHIRQRRLQFRNRRLGSAV